jgi:hypothetical protein
LAAKAISAAGDAARAKGMANGWVHKMVSQIRIRQVFIAEEQLNRRAMANKKREPRQQSWNNIRLKAGREVGQRRHSGLLQRGAFHLWVSHHSFERLDMLWRHVLKPRLQPAQRSAIPFG